MSSDFPAAALRDEAELEQYRRELTSYCYRMLGSPFEAEDAVQETMLRAWRGAAEFQGRSSQRTWLYRIATNICLDMLRGRRRRALPIGLVPSTSANDPVLGPALPQTRWVLPVPDARVLPDSSDPAELAASRESVQLAFVAALMCLPARQRAVLILREVLGLTAAEVADLLGTTTASVTSALQRARVTLAGQAALPTPPSRPDDAARHRLLAEYVDAFERYDVARLTSLLRDDAVQQMPPFALWIQGADEIGRWMLGPGSECRGSRLLPTSANGCPAFAHYRSDGRGGHRAFSMQLLEVEPEGDRIRALHSFLLPELFATFSFPLTL
ncbi:RNA polymerase sigma-70 factor (ECF subfamily) [Streptacidiphilus sp. MAP12-20]|uniref:sigma-70 family RNA polymerase sigma factor n=1 Tax=Streptacidiphilus sp. MAP12-20 TaxID=3156299 RepID=UPI003517C42A